MVPGLLVPRLYEWQAATGMLFSTSRANVESDASGEKWAKVSLRGRAQVVSHEPLLFLHHFSRVCSVWTFSSRSDFGFTVVQVYDDIQHWEAVPSFTSRNLIIARLVVNSTGVITAFPAWQVGGKHANVVQTTNVDKNVFIHMPFSKHLHYRHILTPLQLKSRELTF